jgi:hypothetical protein
MSERTSCRIIMIVGVMKRFLWGPHDIGSDSPTHDTFCHNEHTQGKLPGHTKFWYPSRDSLVSSISYPWEDLRVFCEKDFLPSIKIFEKTGETPTVTRGLRTGRQQKNWVDQNKFEGFRLVPALSQGSRAFTSLDPWDQVWNQSWNPI